MKYFTEDLDIIELEVKKLQEDCKNNPEDVDVLALKFSQELLEVQKLLTIEKYLKTKSNFYKDKIKAKITSSVPDSIVNNYGIGMTEESFNLYLELYNNQFELC